MERHSDNAERVVEFLTGHPEVSHVYYPGLPEHPGHEVAARQMKRFGGIVSFRVTGGEEQALAVCDRTEVFTLGESLGGVESLIEHPGRMTHASVAGTELEVPGRPDPAQRRHRDRRRPGRRPRAVPRWLTRCSCVDFGSTFTKAALVDAGSGTLLGTAAHRTTIDTDVLDGYDACVAALRAEHPEVDGAKVLACSSAGGGLRVAVVGNEELVTAEAGRRVALSSGGKVVHVVALAGDADPLPGLRREQARRGAAGRRHRRRQHRGAAGRRTDAGRGALARRRSWWPATSRPARGRRGAPGRVGDAVRARRQRRPPDRCARPRLRTGRDPRRCSWPT